MAQRKRNSEVTSGAGKVLKSPTKRAKSAAASALTQRSKFARNVREIGKRDSAGLIKLADR